MDVRVVTGALFGLVALVGAGPARADMLNYHADLTAVDEVPPTGTSGMGHLTASFDTLTKDFSYKVEYQGLTGPANAAHFHAPAPKGQNAAVAIPISGSLASPIAGSTKLTEAQSNALADGKMYFNVHTVAHKSGEIRGQLEKGM
jgi:CHRD domain